MAAPNGTEEKNDSAVKSDSTKQGEKRFDKIKKLFVRKKTNQPTLLSHVLTILVLSGVTIGCHKYLTFRAEEQISSWELRPEKCEENTGQDKEDSNEPKPIKCEKIFEVVEPNVRKAPAAIARLEEQLDEAVTFGDKNLNILVDLAKIQFVSIWMSSGAFIIAGICGFRISKDGWEKANNILFTVFTATMIIGVSYQQSQSFLKIETNIQSNFEMHQHNRNIEREIRSYFRTYQRFSEDKLQNINPIRFVHEIDKQLSKQRPLLVEFDGTEIIEANDIIQKMNDIPSSTD